MDSHAKENAADNLQDELLEFSSPADERFRGQILFRNSDNSDPREKPGQSEKQDNADKPDRSDGQAHDHNLKMITLIITSTTLITSCTYDAHVSPFRIRKL